MLERSPHKLDKHRFTVGQLDWLQRLVEKADAVGVPPPDLNSDAVLWEVLRSDDLYSVCALERRWFPTMRRGSVSLAVCA